MGTFLTLEGVMQGPSGPGAEIQVPGSGELIQTLMEHDLVDEYRLWVLALEQ